MPRVGARSDIAKARRSAPVIGRIWTCLWLLFACGIVQAIWTPALARPEAPQLVLVTNIRGAVGPATARQVSDALSLARARHAGAVVIALNTPGGLATSTREIITDVLGSTVPVIGYVTPRGAHAASAGTYILYATSLAAMAPGTNLGAATPIRIGNLPGLPEQPGNREPDALQHKMINDAVAQIRALAEIHGRNAAWAEAAVREAATLTAQQALREHVVEIVAPDIANLLRQANGRSVITAAGARMLDTRNAQVEHVEPGLMVRILGVLANPNVAFILMMIGVYGLIFEFANPGTIAPGLIGAIALVLGLYALNQLPLDYIGLALLLLGVALMVAEAFTPGLGALGTGGLVAFILGSAMLVDSDSPEFRLSWTVIGGTAALTGAVLVLLLGYVWRSQKRRVITGREEMHGASGRVITWRGGGGAVSVHGERWQARGPEGLKSGDPVHVIAIDGLTLVVERTSAAAKPP